MAINRLDEFCGSIIGFIENRKIPYLVIGDLAVSVIGEPRMTQDIDLIVSIEKDEVHKVLSEAKNSGFKLDIKKELQRVKQTGTFRLKIEHFHADFIIASTPLEESAFARVQKIRIIEKEISFPSPENLILFKIIVGREKDMLDAKSITIRHKKHLDRKYLEKWARFFSDEAEDMAIWDRLMKLLEDK